MDNTSTYPSPFTGIIDTAAKPSHTKTELEQRFDCAKSVVEKVVQDLLTIKNNLFNKKPISLRYHVRQEAKEHNLFEPGNSLGVDVTIHKKAYKPGYYRPYKIECLGFIWELK